MRKLLSSILFISFFSTNIAFAQEANVVLPATETPTGEVDPGAAISPIKLNQKVPFSGVLLSPKAISSIIARLKSVDDRVKLAADESKETAEEVCRSEKNVQQIRNTADLDILRARIEDNQRNLKLYESHINNLQNSQTDPGLLIGLGAVGGAVATVLTVFAVSQAVK